MPQKRADHPKSKEARARRRAEVIMKVRSGQITATQGAQELGVSRKTYYDWENRALSAMADALEDRKPGRPKRDIDHQNEALQKQVDERIRVVAL